MTFQYAHGRSCLAGLILIVALTSCGCPKHAQTSSPDPKHPAKKHSIRVVVVDDPRLGEAIQRQWKATTSSEIELRQMPIERMETIKQIAADVIVYPSVCLGTLAERQLIVPFSREALSDPQFAERDILDLQRLAEVRWGEQVYAVSFGSPQLVLLYRADLFEKLNLKPPATWNEYQELAARLTPDPLGDAAPPADRRWAAVIEPMADRWGAQVLLARAAAYARHPSQYSALFDYTTMEPMIDGPPFVRALKQLVAASSSGPKDAEQYTPKTAKEALFRGEAAMVLAWPSRAGMLKPAPMAKGIEIGFAQLPGAVEAYNFGEKQWTPTTKDESRRVPLLAIAGRLGSVTHEARRPREAAQMLTWLAGKQRSSVVAPYSAATTLYRKSHLNKPAIWTDLGITPKASRQYAEVVDQTQAYPTHMATLRVPGWKRYLKALDQAVQNARTGRKSPADALAETARQWREITGQLGLKAQQAAYTRSLGLEP